ncbi:tetratricopeptide repeat protein [Nocardia farcinica]|uniref:tetratricopeptide repeat protein n=1 Tax=Nocardia farcinica TaxID=37329 RepID=UPI000A36E5F2|nr:tetratricopeptide repeat protein [Nocardia farcinica]MBA4855149.1 tetratricopeptide repeat protein [Nocardia farcinica]MBC9815853.1 tetratricopeptide repeat protein [Nocardia farcinica]MBF6231309.1 tetratricopeptide repeat protein [Nocardia farcinica]MBF6269376.1 tetratricopeptide repeat protein [Nocardia farcinica]MBF6519087.1 tetratricopeptide repeat protein [Nocardia farcinica]
MSGAVDLSSLKQPPAGASGGAGGGYAVSEADFETKVLRRSLQVPVVVALYSQRSPGSVELVRTLERMVAADGGTWDLATVEAEANMRIAQALRVQGIPTVIAIAAGQPLADFEGAQPEPQVRQWIDAVVQAVAGKLEGDGGEPQPQEDPRFVAAEEALERGDMAAAEAAYEQILAAEPNNTEAKGALRQLRFLARAQQVPADAVATADADPANVDAAIAAADLELLNQQPEAAFDRLIAVVKRSAGDDRTKARTHLLELFELFDQAEPFVVAARRKLAAALY